MHVGLTKEELTFHYVGILEEDLTGWLLNMQNREILFPAIDCEIDEQEKTIYAPEWLAIRLGLV